jgi:hypothetical protein
MPQVGHKPTDTPEPAKPAAENRPPRGRRGSYRVRLTDIERQVYDLRHSEDPQLTFTEIGRRLGKDRANVSRYYKKALVKVGREGELAAHPGSLQHKDPQKYAKLVEELTPADGVADTVKAIAKRLNIPQTTANAIAMELRSVYFPTKIELQNVKLDYLKDLWSMRAMQALSAMTPEKFAKSGLRDLGIMAGIATDKLLLLRGQPTQIVRNEADRTKIDVLAKAFIAEAERRGYEVEANAATGEVDITYDISRSAFNDRKKEEAQELEARCSGQDQEGRRSQACGCAEKGEAHDSDKGRCGQVREAPEPERQHGVDVEGAGEAPNG